MGGGGVRTRLLISSQLYLVTLSSSSSESSSSPKVVVGLLVAGIKLGTGLKLVTNSSSQPISPPDSSSPQISGSKL